MFLPLMLLCTNHAFKYCQIWEMNTEFYNKRRSSCHLSFAVH
jgi:hypothetical protein